MRVIHTHTHKHTGLAESIHLRGVVSARISVFMIVECVCVFPSAESDARIRLKNREGILMICELSLYIYINSKCFFYHRVDVIKSSLFYLICWVCVGVNQGGIKHGKKEHLSQHALR